ncbi:MAG: MFS transporter [Gemmataceae bacterium]|nr:MFS transporter [Gemmataceae bacterium]
MWAVRGRFASLWLSQVARILADNCLRVFVLLQLVQAGTAADRESAWHLLTALMVLPAVFFAPLNGAVSNSLPKPLVLTGSALYCSGVVLAFALAGGAWVACWALVAVGAAVYSPTRYALLPAAAQDGATSLTRVNALIEMGATVAIVAGWVLGGRLRDSLWWDLDAAVVLAGGLNVLAALTALLVWFRADVSRPERAGQAVAGFFRDVSRTLANRQARWSLLALSSLRGLAAAMMGALVAVVLGAGGDRFDEMLEVAIWVMVGIAAGSLLAGAQWHPRRALGLVPFGATGLFVGLVVAALGAVPALGLCVVLGAMGGLVNVPLAAAYQAAVPADARGNAMSVRNFADYLFMAVGAGSMFALSRLRLLDATGQLWVVAAVAGVWALLSWRALFRPALEQVLEMLIAPLYRIRARGPGLEHFPTHGPLLVVANHSAWFDPLWLGKVVPRRVIPMMTSVFYDLPLLRWLMKHVVQAIRVQAATFRREVPELDEAVAALDRGECVIIFPEGGLRRRADQPLRQFGQGVWRILRERPATPVVVCWIEGGWGSYCSYCKGPPTRNKRLDFRRRIDIAVEAPQVLDKALLGDRRATRAHLMQICLEARAYLGLEPLTAEPLDAEEGAGSKEAEME